MKRQQGFFQMWGIAASLILLLLALSVAAYAWFTSNRTVDTDRATVRSGSETVELQISSAGGNAFSGSAEADLVQVNAADRTNLMPVSTADLKTFVYCPASSGDRAAAFQVVEDEKYYYHGRIYLRAVSEGEAVGSKMALYLDEGDEAGGKMVQANSGGLLNAARLGLTFDGSHSVIFYLSDTKEAVNGQAGNTVLNGTLLGADQVLDGSGGAIQGAADPSVSISSYRIVMEDSAASLPAEPLIYMELNRIYMVDVYFYIEGCDPDCTDQISLNAADLHLAFYGILKE